MRSTRRPQASHDTREGFASGSARRRSRRRPPASSPISARSGSAARYASRGSLRARKPRTTRSSSHWLPRRGGSWKKAMAAGSAHLPEGVRDLRERGAPGREEAAEEAHHEGEHDARAEERGRQAEREDDLGERREVRRARDAREGELHEEEPEKAADDSPEEGEAEGLEHERDQDREPREPERPERRDLARPRGDGRVHRIHRAEARADRHDDPHEEAEELDRGGGGGLVVVVLALDLALEREPGVAREAGDELVARGAAGRLREDRRVTGPLEVRDHPLDVRPDLAVGRGPPRVEEADDRPAVRAEPDRLARR